MSSYAYRAREASGSLIKGMLEAVDELDVATRLAQFGYFLVQAKERVAAQKAAAAGRARIKLKPKELLTFTVNLATLINAGVPLLEALNGLHKDAAHPHTQVLFADLTRRIQAGSTLKDALAAHPRTFSELYCALVGAGEATGKLDTMLNDLARIIEWQLDVKAKIREATIYPVLLSLAMIGVVTLLVIKVIPLFATVLASVGAALPLPTRIVLAVSEVANTYLPSCLILVALLVAAARLASGTEQGRVVLDGAKLRLPFFGMLFHKIALSRFCHVLGLCLSAGIPVLNALALSMKAAGNARIARAIHRTIGTISTGQDLSSALARTKLFPSLVIRMVAVGEQSGLMEQCLEKVNQFYDKEIPATIRVIFVLFEPLMIVGIGLIVGGIALSLFMPLFQLTRALGGS